MNRLLIVLLVIWLPPLSLAETSVWDKNHRWIVSQAVRVVSPTYPLEARRQELQGGGVFVSELRSDGSVATVSIQQSTGYSILDRAAILALRQWRFKPGVFTKVRIPVNFTLQGASWAKIPDAVKPFVISSPLPRLGFNVHGVYQLSIAPDGSVSHVAVVQETGYGSVEQLAIASLKKWRFRPGSAHTVTIPVFFGP